MAALLLAVAIPAGAGPQHRARMDSALERAAGSASAHPQAVIVRAAPGGRAAIREWLFARGYRVLADHPTIGAVTAVIPASDLQFLASESSVVSLSSDAIVRPAGLTAVADVVAPVARDSYLRQTLGLTAASPAGWGVGVALIDSGVRPSVDFAGRVSAFYDLTNGGFKRVPAYDDYGHGTHVAGLIGGNGAGSAGEFKGVAPGVRFVVFKVLDRSGQGRTSDVVRAIEFIVANRRLLGVDIINLSLGHPIFEPAESDPLVQAIEQATRAGLVVVAAAGNFGTNPETGLPGYAGITSPGNAPSAITVGALLAKGTVSRTDDRVAPFSSRGPSWFDAFAKPDVLAPGDRLVSVGAPGTPLYEQWPAQQVPGALGGAYLRLSGTSMATGVTTGVVAAAIEANRRRSHGEALAANALKAALQYTAFTVRDDQGADYDRLTQGGGGINGAGAIALAAAINPAVPEGDVWLSPQPEPLTVIAGEPLPWAQNIVWGVWLVPGSVLETNNACWGSNIVWGVADGHNIVWGVNEAPPPEALNIVWGVADNIVWGVNAGEWVGGR